MRHKNSGHRDRVSFTIFRDFNAPLTPPRPADSSAATIAATALILLASQEFSLNQNTTGQQYWMNAAIQVSNIYPLFSAVIFIDGVCIAVERYHAFGVGASVGKLVVERDSEHACQPTQQPHWDRLWCVTSELMFVDARANTHGPCAQAIITL